MAAALVLGAPAISAQEAKYPSRTITLVIPYGPGSANDILARMLAPEVATHLNQSVVIENKPGAGGSIGTAAIARAKNDGYTVGLGGSATLGVNPALYKTLPYSAQSDFTRVLKLASTPNVLVVPAEAKIANTQDFLAQMKSRTLRYNSQGNGTTAHLAGALVAHQLNVKADHIPYKNAGEMLTALLTSQVDFGLHPLAGVIGQIRDGRLRALGVSTLNPSKALPNVPSLIPDLRATGLKNFEYANVWFGIIAPKGIPRDAQMALHGAFVAALSKPVIRDKLISMGYELEPSASPEEFEQFLRDQQGFWVDLVRISGAKVE
ncbi:Bug family tripartite tricarboxylate transporter substrate binding protein [Lacisediminimonas profundi]|uniref:Bug family tripartite tricarboxylate transporter substrate binding protein n=1 Tax=Lacisediminimonas profundi TaxID=2603856 RepID=UPI0013873B4D|nr:tripartite tricarboxylate transporter substrate binding protein [Lacisediminimonas profundi]